METHKNLGVIAIIGGALLIIVVTFFMSISSNIAQPTIVLKLGDGIFKAKVATTETDRSKGLVGVTKLDSDQALLMVFPSEKKWGIWMKDMKVPIDIVWLDSSKKVVYAVIDASPNVSTSETFSPKLPAMYVVELPAGTVKNRVISTGSVAVFNVNTVLGMK